MGFKYMFKCFKNDKLTCLAFIVLVAIALTLGVILFWLLYPYKVSEVKSPAEVITKTLKPGEYLQYRFQAEVFNPHDVDSVNRKLSNGSSYIMESTHPPRPKAGKVDVVVSSNKIPSNICPGEYKMVFEAEHRVNPIRTVSVEWETEKFQIVRE